MRNLRFTMSYLDALANVEAVSRERRCIRGFLGGSVVPSVRLSSFSFTGATAAGWRDGAGGDGHRRRPRGDLTLYAEHDGSISVDMGSRFVAVGGDDLERILDRLAADGGTLRLLGGTGRADDGDEAPDLESDPAMGAASYVLALAHERGLEVISEA